MNLEPTSLSYSVSVKEAMHMGLYYIPILIHFTLHYIQRRIRQHNPRSLFIVSYISGIAGKVARKDRESELNWR